MTEGTDMNQIEKVARGLTKAQREAAVEGRVAECPYNHPVGTRCPNCSSWPFKKGGSGDFIAAVRAELERIADE